MKSYIKLTTTDGEAYYLNVEAIVGFYKDPSWTVVNLTDHSNITVQEKPEYIIERLGLKPVALKD